MGNNFAPRGNFCPQKNRKTEKNAKTSRPPPPRDSQFLSQRSEIRFHSILWAKKCKTGLLFGLRQRLWVTPGASPLPRDSRKFFFFQKHSECVCMDVKTKVSYKKPKNSEKKISRGGGQKSRGGDKKNWPDRFSSNRLEKILLQKISTMGAFSKKNFHILDLEKKNQKSPKNSHFGPSK